MALRVGKYQTVRPIASGGMATVYLGKATGVGGFERLVAIKVMHPHIAQEQGYVDMFLDEARLAARIRHPNVVATLDVEQDDTGCPYLVMDFVEGPTLGQLIKVARKEGGQMPLEVALRIVIDGLSGLHAAHELVGADKQPLNLVHRDVSPQNVIVGRDGIARLTDFGVAKARVRIHSTRSTQLKGKLAYLAPEQLGDQPVDRRADIFAAGVVLWETLTGRRLFKAATEAALVKKLVDGVQQSPRELCPDLPAEVDAVCMKALSFEPADRFASAAVFADALEDAAAAAGIRIGSARTVADYIRTLPLSLPSASMPPPEGEDTDLSLPSLGSSRGGGELTEAGMAHTRDSTPPKRSRAPKALVALGVIAALVVAGVVFLRPKVTPDAAPLPPAQPAAQAPSPEATDTARAASTASASAEPAAVTDQALASASASASAAPQATTGVTATAPHAPVGPAKPWVRPKAHSDYRPNDL